MQPNDIKGEANKVEQKEEKKGEEKKNSPGMESPTALGIINER